VKRLAIFASGAGSNMARVVAACQGGEIAAEAALVVVNRPEAGAIARASAAGVPVLVADHRAYAGREAHERAIAAHLDREGIDVVVLAGYMRLLSPYLVGHMHDPALGHARILNVHPADPARYQGSDGYGWAIASGQAATAITVHVVDEGMDTGPVLLQAPVPILPGDTVEALRERGLAVEHRIYPLAIAAFLERIERRRPCVAS
jgi:formyltetrahydrofolate-dependent phosphoribosylglycinamide formyltransferase